MPRRAQVLGKGAFGTVFYAEDGAKQAYACKSISKAKLITDVRASLPPAAARGPAAASWQRPMVRACAGQEDVKDVRREIEVLNLVSDHGNVAALQATFEDAQNVHMVLELCRGGELFDRIISKGTFTEQTAAGAPPAPLRHARARARLPAPRALALARLGGRRGPDERGRRAAALAPPHAAQPGRACPGKRCMRARLRAAQATSGRWWRWCTTCTSWA